MDEVQLPLLEFNFRKWREWLAVNRNNPVGEGECPHNCPVHQYLRNTRYGERAFFVTTDVLYVWPRTEPEDDVRPMVYALPGAVKALITAIDDASKTGIGYYQTWRGAEVLELMRTQKLGAWREQDVDTLAA